MADPERRQRESRERDETRFEERLDEEQADRSEAAERVRRDPPPEPREDQPS